MRVYAVYFFLTSMLFAFTSAAQAPNLAALDVVERSVPAGPVAIVGKTAIEGKEFLRQYRRHLHNVMYMVDAQEVTDEFRVHAGLTILGDMIRHEIMLQEAKRRNITASDSDVDREYQEKLRYFERLLSEEIGASPTEAQVLERAGQTQAEAKESIREQLLVETASERIAQEQGVSVTAAEVKDYYEKNPHLFERAGRMHLQQILILPKPNPGRADESAWKRAEDQAERARARVLAGEQFAAVARDVSEAPDAPQGGDMGMLAVVELPPFFVEVAAMMQPGDISGVFRSEYGVHLIRLVEKETADKVTLEDGEPAIRRMLMHIKIDEAVLRFCEPIVNDPDKTKIFIQLDRTLAALSGGR